MKKISIIILSVFSLISCEEKPTKEQLHRKQIESLFYYENGPHKTAYHLISQQAKDPNSLENLGCYYVEDTIENTLDVNWEFTATNSFGGRLRYYVSFKSDTLGNIIETYKWVE